MPFVVIVGRCVRAAELLARKVGERLGYRFIHKTAIIERAAAWGVARERLLMVGGPTPVLAEWSLRNPEVEVIILRAALAAEAADSEAIFSGCEGLLLPRNTTPVLRILLNVPLQFRMADLKRRLQFTDAEARRDIRRADRAHCRSVQNVCGSDDGDSTLYDLVLNIDGLDFDSASATVAAFVLDQVTFRAEPEYHTAMTDFALASRIEAVLAIMPQTAHLNATVRTDRGLVFLAAKRWDPRDRASICGTVSLIPGARRVELIELGPERGCLAEVARNSKAIRWRTWAIPATVLSLIAAAYLGLTYFETNRTRNILVTGVITDTRCATNHRASTDAERARCVMECVEIRNQAEYALFDGAQIYRLNNAAIGTRFAARAVTISGRFDPNAHVLQVQSITFASAKDVPKVHRGQ